MKGNLTLKLLEAIKDQSMNTIDYLEAFITSGYGASFEMIEKNMIEMSLQRKNKNYLKNIKSKISKEEWQKINNRFNAMVSKLEKDGLIEKSKIKEKKFVKITKEGKKKMGYLKNRSSLFPNNNYKMIKNNNFILFMFDIPEKERNKRKWIRSVLINMEFKMIQKSVWLGKVKIPEEFLKNLRKLEVIQFIEIIEITKTGSLRQLT